MGMNVEINERNSEIQPTVGTHWEYKDGSIYKVIVGTGERLRSFVTSTN